MQYLSISAKDTVIHSCDDIANEMSAFFAFPSDLLVFLGTSRASLGSHGVAQGVHFFARFGYHIPFVGSIA